MRAAWGRRGLGRRAASGGAAVRTLRAGGAGASAARRCAMSRRGARSGSKMFHCAPV
jgi:hypothetical protein